jgi:hypothetical protein
MDVRLETTEACLEKIKVNRGKVKIKVEVCLEEAAVETTRILKDRSGDRHLAVRRRGRWKKRTQGDCGPEKSWPSPVNG